MGKPKFTRKEILEILSEQTGRGTPRVICAKHNISRATFYNWKAKYTEISYSDRQRLRDLRIENDLLKNEIKSLKKQIRANKED